MAVRVPTVTWERSMACRGGGAMWCSSSSHSTGGDDFPVSLVLKSRCVCTNVWSISPLLCNSGSDSTLNASCCVDLWINGNWSKDSSGNWLVARSLVVAVGRTNVGGESLGDRDDESSWGLASRGFRNDRVDRAEVVLSHASMSTTFGAWTTAVSGDDDPSNWSWWPLSQCKSGDGTWWALWMVDTISTGLEAWRWWYDTS